MSWGTCNETQILGFVTRPQIPKRRIKFIEWGYYIPAQPG